MFAQRPERRPHINLKGYTTPENLMGEDPEPLLTDSYLPNKCNIRFHIPHKISQIKVILGFSSNNLAWKIRVRGLFLFFYFAIKIGVQGLFFYFKKNRGAGAFLLLFYCRLGLFKGVL